MRVPALQEVGVDGPRPVSIWMCVNNCVCGWRPASTGCMCICWTWLRWVAALVWSMIPVLLTSEWRGEVGEGRTLVNLFRTQRLLRLLTRPKLVPVRYIWLNIHICILTLTQVKSSRNIMDMQLKRKSMHTSNSLNLSWRTSIFSIKIHQKRIREKWRCVWKPEICKLSHHFY